MNKIVIQSILVSLAVMHAPQGGMYAHDPFQDAMDAIREDVGVRGISVTVIGPDGIVRSAASNMPGKDNPVDTGMLFGIGSMTKTYIEYCMFRLIEETKYAAAPLTLDSAIKTWLYDGDNPPLSSLFKTLIDPDITVGQLMNHTSGVFDYQQNPFYLAAVYADRGRVWRPIEILYFVGTPSFAPGAQYGYSNTNYILLGMIVERLTGSDVLSVCREHVIYPHSFTNTFMRCLEPVIGVTAVGYEKNPYGGYFTARTLVGSGTSLYSSSWTCGNIVTSSGDLARWIGIYYAYQKKCGFIDGPEYARFWSRADNDELESVCAACTRDYGLCMMKFDFSSVLPGCVVYGHTGSIPGYNGFMAYWPARKISVAVLMNDHAADRYMVLLEILEYCSALTFQELTPLQVPAQETQ